MRFIVDNFSSGQVPRKSRTYTILYYIGSIMAVFSYNNIQYTVGTYLGTYMDMDYRCIVIFHKYIITITDILILEGSRIHSAN